MSLPQIPQLKPVEQPEDMANQEFLLRWQTPIDLLGSYPERQIALATVVRAVGGITMPDLMTAVEELQGLEPRIQFDRNKSALLSFVSDHFVQDGFCSGSKQKIYFANNEGATKATQLVATPFGQGCLPLLGVLGVWQLKYGTTLEPILGQKSSEHSDVPFSGAGSRRLRILQDAVVEGRTSLERVRMHMPSLPTATVFFSLRSLCDSMVLNSYSRFNPSDRLIEILGDSPGETRRKYDEVTKTLATACGNFLQQGRRQITAFDLIAEAHKLAPDITKDDLRDKISKAPLSFFRYCDEHIFGKRDQRPIAKSVFLLKPGIKRLASELLTSIMSLDDPAFRERAESAALEILKTPLLVKRLLTLPTELEQALPLIPIPKHLLRKAKELAQQMPTFKYEELEASLEKLFEMEILVSPDGNKVEFADRLRRLSPIALRLLLRAKNLEVLFYGGKLSQSEIQRSINLGVLPVDDYIKQRVIPLVYTLVTKSDLKRDGL
ncbi:MAG TPA: hypothetical protein VFB59_02990 [Candidatus Saccharimonadales bacterium]|nr:hypothetical protein [Candidatus Saccharimonadales bacterium]